MARDREGGSDDGGAARSVQGEEDGLERVRQAAEVQGVDGGVGDLRRGVPGRDALEGKGPQRRPQKRLVRRLGAVTVGYKCH